MAGGELRRTETAGEGEHRVEAHVAVAAHARVRRQPRGMVGQERRDDARGESGAQVEREVRQPHPMSHRAREPHGVRRAARGLGVVGLVAPQLERHRDGLVARARDEQRCHGRVDAAAHRDERPPGDRLGSVAGSVRRPREPGARGDRGAERHVQRVGRQFGGVQLSRREAAQLGGDLARPDPRRVEQRRAAHQLDGRRAGGDHRAAAGRLEAGVDHASASTRRSTRIRSPQAAPPALPEHDAGGTCPRPRGNCKCSANASASTRRV